MTPASIALSFYRGAAWLATPLLQRHMLRRAQRGKEDPARLSERYGHAGRRREPGPLIWLHAASVGESLSVLSLIDEIMTRWPKLQPLLTTGTLSSAQLMAKRLPDRVIHQFVPVDLPAAVERFYDHWRPDLGLLVESELWPNLIDLAGHRKIPLLLVNARISEGSFRAWRRSGPVIRHLMYGFEEILAQSPSDAARFAALGAKQVSTPGNLKFAAAPVAADSERLEDLKARLANHTVWLAASTHTKEAASVIEAHLRVRRGHPHALTVVAPRHPQRSGKILEAIKAAGLSAARQSDGAPIDPNKDFYIADRLGELGLWYRLTDVVFVGGSLIPKGGHNPIEPARLDCAILYGPHDGNFEKIAKEMQGQDAMTMVADGMALGNAVSSLLSDPAEAARHAAAARSYAESHARVMDNVISTLAPYLDQAIQRYDA